jgi:hypothetical protein
MPVRSQHPLPCLPLSFLLLSFLYLHNSLLSSVTFIRLSINIKVKLSLCLTKQHAMNAYWGNGGIAPCILNLGPICKRVVRFTPRMLHRRAESTSYPFDEAGWVPEPVCRRWRTEKIQSLPSRERTPVVEPATY